MFLLAQVNYLNNSNFLKKVLVSIVQYILYRLEKTLIGKYQNFTSIVGYILKLNGSFLLLLTPSSIYSFRSERRKQTHH